MDSSELAPPQSQSRKHDRSPVRSLEEHLHPRELVCIESNSFVGRLLDEFVGNSAHESVFFPVTMLDEVLCFRGVRMRKFPINFPVSREVVRETFAARSSSQVEFEP